LSDPQSRLLPQEFEPLGPGVRGVIGALKAANEDLFYLDQGERERIVNEITYTDENGVLQFLRRSLLAGAFKFDKRVSQVLPYVLMGQFRTCINYVSKLICIGYRFGDVHINDVIRHWLESTGNRRIEIVGPAASVPPLLLHLRLKWPLHVCAQLISWSDSLSRLCPCGSGFGEMYALRRVC